MGEAAGRVQQVHCRQRRWATGKAGRAWPAGGVGCVAGRVQCFRQPTSRLHNPSSPGRQKVKPPAAEPPPPLTSSTGGGRYTPPSTRCDVRRSRAACTRPGKGKGEHRRARQAGPYLASGAQHVRGSLQLATAVQLNLLLTCQWVAHLRALARPAPPAWPRRLAPQTPPSPCQPPPACHQPGKIEVTSRGAVCPQAGADQANGPVEKIPGIAGLLIGLPAGNASQSSASQPHFSHWGGERGAPAGLCPCSHLSASASRQRPSSSPPRPHCCATASTASSADRQAC